MLWPQAAFHGVTGTKVLAFNGHWDNLELGHCESGVWNTGWCCIALPTLYYSTIFPSTWIRDSPNFGRAMRRQSTLCESLFITVSPFLSPYLYLWSLAI